MKDATDRNTFIYKYALSRYSKKNTIRRWIRKVSLKLNSIVYV